MSKLGVTLARATVVAASLAAIVAALGWTHATHAIWRGTLLATAAFYALAQFAPGPIFRWQSMPYTYQLPNNVGRRGFELQNVTYAAYHTHWYNRATHAAFPVEAWLWFAVAAHFGGALGCAALAAVLIAQAFSFGERRFALALGALWLAFAASALAAAHALGGADYAAAQAGLVSLGFWRFSGHWFEPLPPGLVGNRGFVRLADATARWRILPAAALGYLSEFSAGLPFRLVNSWLFRLAERLGYQPREALPRAATDALALRIHREGWSAQATTAAIVTAARALEPASAPSPDPERRERARRATTLPASALASPEIRLMACDAGASVWLLAIGGRTILFDCWLDDPYISGSRAFFSARRLEAPLVAAEDLPALDAIVLSSAEQDHCHPRTLARLDRRVPVVARREAAGIARRAGFASVTTLAPGAPLELCDGAVSALALPGHGRNSAVVLRDNARGQRVCIAQHGVQARWLERNAARVFRGPFAADAGGRLVDTLCLGVHTTLLGHRFLPAWSIGDASTIVPDPRDSALSVARLAPRRVLFSHCTPEAEEGFAVRHLLHYPSAADDVGYAKQVLAASCEGIAIEGLPAPATWV